MATPTPPSPCPGAWAFLVRTTHLAYDDECKRFHGSGRWSLCPSHEVLHVQWATFYGLFQRFAHDVETPDLLAYCTIVTSQGFGESDGCEAKVPDLRECSDGGLNH